nr:toprim domain-containing protein [Tsuneonella amylolytica]
MQSRSEGQNTQSLEATARQLCKSRGGRWSGFKGMARCPAHDDRTPSLGVTLGRRAILFHCFAGCDQASVIDAFRREGLSPSQLFDGSPLNAAESKIELSPSRSALRTWRGASPLIGSPAKAYLEARGITAISPALRFNSRTPLGPKGRAQFLPAMIAAVSLDEGPIAIHRTFLDAEAPRLATFDGPKRALGALRAAAVRLFPAIDGVLGIAEGVESALSARALTGVPCWATLGNERFALVSIPQSVTELHLFVDYDAGGKLAAERALRSHALEGRTIHVRRPSKRETDWNDELVNWLARKQAS